jgi:hypothetical protein
MTLTARFVQPRHCQAAARFHDVAAVRVVALHAIHPILDDGMMVRQVELGVRFDMTLKTCRRIFAGIHDQSGAPGAGFDVFAPRPMTGFATGSRRPFQIIPVKPAVSTAREQARNFRVTVRAHLIADVMRAFNLRRFNDRPIQRRTRSKKKAATTNAPVKKKHRQCFIAKWVHKQAAGSGKGRSFRADNWRNGDAISSSFPPGNHFVGGPS